MLFMMLIINGIGQDLQYMVAFGFLQITSMFPKMIIYKKQAIQLSVSTHPESSSTTMLRY